MSLITDVISVDKLPSPPSGKVGFPWYEQSKPLSDYHLDAFKLPRISIITPSFNQGQFIEETIRSVLLQNYPNLEYIIIDGGSTDNTIEIIKKYQPWISYWVSEPDRGQAHAINKGIKQATGTILAYLNSDDYYLPGALLQVANHFQKSSDIALLHGRCCYVDENGNKIGEQVGQITRISEILDLWDFWWKKRQFVQPEVFWRREITEQIGLFNEELNFVLDYEYWCRILQANGKVKALDSALSCFRFTQLQKSNHSELVAQELLTVVQAYLWDNAFPLPVWKRLFLQGKWLYQVVFLQQVERSLELDDRPFLRWIKLLDTTRKNPQILLAPDLHRRIKFSVPQVFQRKLKRP